jgi:hypothetical protein
MGAPFVNGRMIVKWILEKQGVQNWTGMNCVKIESNGGLS